MKSHDGCGLDSWAASVLADPVTKKASTEAALEHVNGVIDARVVLRNTYGYSEWESGQDVYESWEASGKGYRNQVAAYRKEIDYDRPVYERFRLEGAVLDVGGGAGTVREFLAEDVHFISIDPFIDAPTRIPPSKLEAYKCLSRPLNFIGALAEFLPFQTERFDWVHMRSMLDHVQVPDLALMEARRVLKPSGSLLVGMTVEGGKTGRKTPKEVLKDAVKAGLELVGIDKYKDHHTWHPTYANLQKLIVSNGFEIVDTYWQPYWQDRVVYIQARKLAHAEVLLARK